jgi:hypothetical protein
MPATALRSLRGQGTVHTAVVGSAETSGPAATITVHSASPRSEPSGADPPVTVMRTRASGGGVGPSTAAMAARSSSSEVWTWRPSPSAECRRRARWRLVAKGTPSTALSVSNTPSPTVRPWSKIDTVASAAGSRVPLIQAWSVMPRS